MKRKRIIRTALLLILIVAGMLVSGCSSAADDGRDAVYEDMKEAFDRSGLFSANIGIFSRTEKMDPLPMARVAAE